MNYACKTFSSVDDLDAVTWQQVCSDKSDVSMDLRYLRSVERAAPEGASFKYLVFSDDDERPVGCACVAQFTIDAAIFFHKLLVAAIGVIRWLVPRYLKFRVVMCGMPVSMGESNFRGHESADADRLMRSLDEQLRAMAKESGAWVIITKECTNDERVLMDPLVNCGHLRAPSLPMNTFSHSFGSFDEFMAALRSHYRYKIKRSRKKFLKAGVEIHRLTDAEEIERLYTPEMHALYEGIVEKAAHRLEILPREFFIELTRNLSPDVVFTMLRHEDRVVAFAWSMASDGVYRNMFVGVDPDASPELDAYFNLMMVDMDNALKQGAERIMFGQSADTFKSRLGCRPDPRWIYVYVVPRWLHWCMMRFTGWLFPSPEEPEDRDLFKPPEMATSES